MPSKLANMYTMQPFFYVNNYVISMRLHDWSTGGLLLVCQLVMSFAKFHGRLVTRELATRQTIWTCRDGLKVVNFLVTSWRHTRLPRNKSVTSWRLPRNICYKEVTRNWSQWNLAFTEYSPLWNWRSSRHTSSGDKRRAHCDRLQWCRRTTERRRQRRCSLGRTQRIAVLDVMILMAILRHSLYNNTDGC